MKYCLSPQEIPRAPPSGFPSGSGNISSYTPPLVTIQLQDPRGRLNLVIQDELKEMLKSNNHDRDIDFTITLHGGTLMYLDGYLFDKEKGPLKTKFGISIRWRSFFFEIAK